jgi:hypothetical protein
MSKKLAVVFGVVFVLVGLLGFISNPIVGAEGFFVTDAIHNVVHLLVGVILLIAGSKSAAAAGKALMIFGIVYLVLAVNGFISSDMLLGFVAANTNDTWLHLVLGIVLLLAGLSGRKQPMMSTGATM